MLNKKKYPIKIIYTTFFLILIGIGIIAKATDGFEYVGYFIIGVGIIFPINYFTAKVRLDNETLIYKDLFSSKKFQIKDIREYSYEERRSKNNSQRYVSIRTERKEIKLDMTIFDKYEALLFIENQLKPLNSNIIQSPKGWFNVWTTIKYSISFISLIILIIVFIYFANTFCI